MKGQMLLHLFVLARAEALLLLYLFVLAISAGLAVPPAQAVGLERLLLYQIGHALLLLCCVLLHQVLLQVRALVTGEWR